MAASSLLALTPDEKQFFDDNGYLIVRGLYKTDEVAGIRERMDDLLRHPELARPGVKFHYEPEEERGKHPIDPNNPHRIWMVFDTPLAGDWWFDNIRDKRVVDIIADLLGPNINFHNGKARIKPPGYKTHQVWHQDWPYERHTQPDLCAALIYLDDTDEDAAATRVLPGSHKRGEWPNEKNIIADGLVDEFIQKTGKEPLTVKACAGDVAFIHVLVVHRAGHNYATTNRSCIINEYKTMETLSRWDNKCAFADLPLRRGRKSVIG